MDRADTARAASSVLTMHGPTISKAGLPRSAIAAPFPHLDIARESLVPVETEIYAGFVFARVQGGGPTVAQMMAPYARRDRHAPVRKARAHRPRHAAAAQGELEERRRQLLRRRCTSPWRIRVSRDCLAPRYRVESREWIDRMSGELSDKPSRNWAERMYQKYLPVGRAPAAATSAAPGCTSSCGPTSHSMSTRTRSTSCSGCRSRPPNT